MPRVCDEINFMTSGKNWPQSDTLAEVGRSILSLSEFYYILYLHLTSAIIAESRIFVVSFPTEPRMLLFANAVLHQSEILKSSLPKEKRKLFVSSSVDSHLIAAIMAGIKTQEIIAL
jgi:hypothetical protein